MARSIKAVLVLALAWPPVEFQTWAQEAKSPEDAPQETRPYTSPPASKSVEIANYYLKRKKYAAALSRYQEAAKTDPTYAPAYLGLGKVYEKMGRNREALQAYQKYLDALPSAKDAAEAKDVQRAIDRLERRRKGSRASTPRPVGNGAAAQKR